MNYNYIVNPETGKRCKATGKLGKKILKKYIMMLNGGGSKCSKYHRDPDTCLKSKSQHNQCLYRNRNGGQCYMSKSSIGGRQKKKRSYRKKKRINEANVNSSSLTKKNIVKRCKPCAKANTTKKWNKLECDWCLGKDEVVKSSLDDSFIGFQSIKNNNHEFDIIQKEFMINARQKELEEVLKAKNTCNSNLENVGLSWNNKINSCTKNYLTKVCKNNKITISECDNYMTELNKKNKKKKKVKNDVCNVSKK